MYLKTSDEIIVTSGYTLRGIVTNSDILQRLVVPANERRISSIPMSSPIIMLRSTGNVSSALKTMRSNNIKQILIVDSNVVGKLKKANEYGSPRSGIVD